MSRLASAPGFTRGLDIYGGIAFVGLSRIRENAVIDNLPLAASGVENRCGVWLVDLRTGDTVGFLQFEGDVREIFAVSVLRDNSFPAILDGDDSLIDGTFVLPDRALAEVSFPEPGDE